MKHILIVSLAALAVTGCFPLQTNEEEENSPPVRGLITTVVESAENTTLRKYPGVLEPGEITSLSFEVAGKLGKLDLSVGQRVSEGDVLAKIDDTQFKVAIENKQAAVEEAEAKLSQDRDDLARKEKLLTTGATTRLSVDEARTDFRTSRAQLVQAQKDLKSAKEDLIDTTLFAPFDGIINSVDADSFATVAVGDKITSIYDVSGYEVSFSVNFDTVSDLVVGTPALIRLADNPDIALKAVVSELGERADTVSSFPVVVLLTETHSIIKSGMAVEVSFEFKLPAEKGYLIPISAAIAEGQIPEDAGPNKVSPLQVYVFDPETGTVKRRDVKTAGIRENKFLIIEGLEPGEHVATAGVSFLREGMKVKLLEPEG
ncbi:MAG: efflux RND transporter periplasmic adaptor subunit [Pseudomonadota bacterium]